VLYKTTFNMNEDGINYDRTVQTLEPMRIMAQRRHHRPRPSEPELESGELVNEVRLNKPFVFSIKDIRTKLVLMSYTPEQSVIQPRQRRACEPEELNADERPNKKRTLPKHSH
jgi:hypothetical protein